MFMYIIYIFKACAIIYMYIYIYLKAYIDKKRVATSACCCILGRKAESQETIPLPCRQIEIYIYIYMYLYSIIVFSLHASFATRAAMSSSEGTRACACHVDCAQTDRVQFIILSCPAAASLSAQSADKTWVSAVSMARFLALLAKSCSLRDWRSSHVFHDSSGSLGGLSSKSDRISLRITILQTRAVKTRPRQAGPETNSKRFLTFFFFKFPRGNNSPV